MLFLSADLVGSTQYKQKGAGWQTIFLSFYREFPQFLANANRTALETYGSTSEFTLWKAIGDELIFEVVVKDEYEVSRAVRVWLQAITAYEEQSLSEEGLALKAGAFIATFPGPDSESTIPRSPGSEVSDAPVILLNDKALAHAGRRQHSKYQYDYFGPSIDTGFRVVTTASRRYFTMTIEVAWALAMAAHLRQAALESDSPHTVTDVVFRGSQVLKGVWKGREYPVFAIDRECADPVNRAVAKLGGPELDAMKIIEVCDACSAEDWPFGIYLPNSTQEKFKLVPEDAMAGLRNAATTLDGVESTPSSITPGQPLEESPPMG
ncbi:MAG: hypothetical protein AAGC66_00210 [Leifsonia sp.]